MNKELIFIFSLLIMVFLIRTIQGIRILLHKKVLYDEVNYVMFAYFTIICGVVVITKQYSVGIIMLVITPVVELIYFAIMPKRVYWIVDGNQTNLSTYGNAIIASDSKYANQELFRKVMFLKKVEGRIMVIFTSLKYEEKEALLNVIKTEAAKQKKTFNVREFVYTLISGVLFLTCLLLLLSVI